MSERMSKAIVPIEQNLLNELADDMAAFDARQEVGRSKLLVEWKVPPMPKRLKGEIRSDEHPPPHFHVMCDGEDASFSIIDGTRLRGVAGLEQYDSVIYNWWQKNRPNSAKPGTRVGQPTAPSAPSPFQHSELPKEARNANKISQLTAQLLLAVLGAPGPTC
jgi:hypothetical protein